MDIGGQQDLRCRAPCAWMARRSTAAKSQEAMEGTRSGLGWESHNKKRGQFTNLHEDICIYIYIFIYIIIIIIIIIIKI